MRPGTPIDPGVRSTVLGSDNRGLESDSLPDPPCHRTRGAMRPGTPIDPGVGSNVLVSGVWGLPETPDARLRIEEVERPTTAPHPRRHAPRYPHPPLCSFERSVARHRGPDSDPRPDPPWHRTRGAINTMRPGTRIHPGVQSSVLGSDHVGREPGRQTEDALFPEGHWPVAEALLFVYRVGATSRKAPTLPDRLRGRDD